MQGSLKVRPIEATLKADKDNIGKMDPYVLLELGNQKFQTMPAIGLGLNPTWNQEFVFNVAGDNELVITIYDAVKGKDDFIGKHTIKLEQLLKGGVVDNYFPLESRVLKTNEGTIHLRLEFTPIGQQGVQGNYQQGVQGSYQQKGYEQDVGFVSQPGIQQPGVQQQGIQQPAQQQGQQGQQQFGQEYPHKY